MRFKKQVLAAGTYHLADGRKVTYTRADVVHLARRLREMVNAGLQVPCAWEHADQAKPMSEEERRINRAKWNAGFADDSLLEPDGTLAVVLDVGEDDARRLPSVRYVSPEIVHDWRDGTGRLWPGASISHIAITPKPVQHRQRPFEAVRLSLLDREDTDMDYSRKLESLRRALGRKGIQLPADVSLDNPTALVDAIIAACDATGDERTQEQAEAEAARMSLAARAANKQAEDWGAWSTGPALSPEEVRRRVDEHFEVTGREHG